MVHPAAKSYGSKTEGDMSPEQLALVKAKFPVSKDVERLSTQGIYEQPATHIRSSSAKARGKANLLADNPGQAPKLERCLGNGALVAVQAKARLGQRFRVVVISRRKRLLDEDNQCEKYLVDLCRYIAVLPSDAPGTAKIEIQQEKIESNEPETYTVEIYEI
jgi:hypothetical protein